MQGFLFVDDTDPTIKYTGMEAGPLNVLPAQSFFNNTFHHLSAPGSETSVGTGLSFSFSGTEFVIGGTIFLKDKQPFSPICAVDGVLFTPEPASDHVGVLCAKQNLSNGMHTVAITVPVSKSTSQLWVDFIQYMPSTVTSGIGNLVTLPPDNPMALGSGWTKVQGDPATFAGLQTEANGAGINFNATGSSVAFLGCPSDNLAQLPPANVVYTVNGNATETITNNTLILFDTELKDGNNQISVKYGGSSGQMPLTFCGYVSTSDQFNPPDGVSTSSSSHSASSTSFRPTSTGGSYASSATKLHVGAGPIVGAVIGGIALGALVVLAVLLLRKYRRRQQAPPDYSDFERAINVTPPSAPPRMPAPARVLSTWRRTLAYSEKQRPPMPPRRSSMLKSIYSVRSFTSYYPSPQTAQVGSEYGSSPPSSPRLRSSPRLDPRNYGKFSSTEPILL
ncbi:hypothetical protein HYPSUDRAFT_72354 [Hypholoma sublateritium FD-334 SS-4]|uniref:Uncharacterized protein n=1 Tax=Hypholoma sublateritium (strain FD-334 SS-4) TaxID=945553 RepID=A0A0D2NDW1_HYPSF|nr:hypothetical protein HYPSUDRAFT_72354 [Hypholoma sublateritium FD-334 SS-4]